MRASGKNNDSKNTIKLSDVLQTISDINCLMEIVNTASISQQTIETFTLYHLYARCMHLNDIKNKLLSDDEYKIIDDTSENKTLLNEIDRSLLLKDNAKQASEMYDLLEISYAALNEFAGQFEQVKKIYDYNHKKNVAIAKAAYEDARAEIIAAHGPKFFGLTRVKTEEKIPSDALFHRRDSNRQNK